jgi:phosphoribosylanthranilate isomerase
VPYLLFHSLVYCRFGAAKPSPIALVFPIPISPSPSAMALSTLVKLSNVTNLTDARYAAGMGVSIIGFPIGEQLADGVTATKYQEITQWLSGMAYCGEFLSPGPELVESAVDAFGLAYVEVAQPVVLPWLSLNKNIKVILRLEYNASHMAQLQSIMRDQAERVDYFLLHGTADRLSDEDLVNLSTLSAQGKVLLGLGLAPDDLLRVIDHVNPAGISINGAAEERPGFKDMSHLQAILEVLEVE